MSCDSVGRGEEERGKVLVKEEEEEEEDREGETDRVLLFDEQTDSFQLYNEDQHKVGGHTVIMIISLYMNNSKLVLVQFFHFTSSPIPCLGSPEG